MITNNDIIIGGTAGLGLLKSLSFLLLVATGKTNQNVQDVIIHGTTNCYAWTLPLQQQLTLSLNFRCHGWFKEYRITS